MHSLLSIRSSPAKPVYFFILILSVTENTFSG